MVGIMGRHERLFFDNVAQHIVVSAIEQLFLDDKDTFFYRTLLDDISKQLNVDVHAYSIRSASIHFLCTFREKELSSRFMQSLGLRYVSYFNKKYGRKGTLWQGRYKSSLVEDRYVLSSISYIESFDDALLSSYSKNALNLEDSIVRAHEMYKLLGKDDACRASVYKKRFPKGCLDCKIASFIEMHLQKQTITGSAEFYKKLENIAGRTFALKKRGRPKKDKNIKKGKNMFEKLVVLDKEKHKELKVSPLEDLKFAKDLSFVPLLANETRKVYELFPVVFTSDENPSLVLITSLGDKNLAINDEGKYITRYVPAFLRRYPFSLVSSKDNPQEKIVLIDEGASSVSKTKGKQLFTKDAEQSEMLKNAIKFLTEFEKEHAKTLAIAKSIKESNILEDREISVGEGDSKKVLVKGFQVVNRDKLNKLDDATLAQWARMGVITFIDYHIESLSKIETLFKLASQNQTK